MRARETVPPSIGCRPPVLRDWLGAVVGYGAIGVPAAVNFTVLAPPVAVVPTLVTVFGNTGMASEKVVAFEAGYRWQLILDLAAFYNLYDDLATVERLPATVAGGLPGLPLRFGNAAERRAYGIEAAAGWQPLEWLSLCSAYIYQRTALSRAAGSRDTTWIAYQNSTPRHQVYGRASVNLGPTLAFDVQGRYVGGSTSAPPTPRR